MSPLWVLCLLLAHGITLIPQCSASSCSTSGYQWIDPLKRCVKLHTNKTDWDTASALCNQENARLITIESWRDYKPLWNITSADIWIGLNDKWQEGTWVWSDGRPATADNWRRYYPGSEPNGWDQENCVILSFTRWHDFPCTTHKAPFICEMVPDECAGITVGNKCHADTTCRLINGTSDVKGNQNGTSNGPFNPNVTSYACTCLAGHTGNGYWCRDIDECISGGHNCHRNAACTNTKGSFSCACKKGYYGNGSTCVDVDECAAGAHNCHPVAVCTNSRGSFACACGKGFSGNGTICADVNECTVDTHGCHGNAHCRNTLGSFSCVCGRGYQGDGKNCTVVQCEEKAINNGRFLAGKGGSSATVQCNLGYVVKKHPYAFSFCVAADTPNTLLKGIWFGGDETCEANQAYCPARSIYGGTVNANAVDTVVTVPCAPVNGKAEHMKVLCKPFFATAGIWDVTSQCAEVCPGNISNGSIDDKGVRCNKGYSHVPDPKNPTPECQPSGQWINTGTCEKACPGTILNGAIDDKGVRCNKGYSHVPDPKNPTPQCQPSGRWINTGTCKTIPNYCAKYRVTEGEIPAGNVGSANKLTCWSGWTLANATDSHRTCQPSSGDRARGAWVGTAQCVYVQNWCPETPIPGGFIAGGVRKSYANVTCNPGYSRSDGQQYRCNLDRTRSWSRGYWLGGNQQCTLQTTATNLNCKANVPNVIVSDAGAVSCTAGYTWVADPSGQAPSCDQPNGVWQNVGMCNPTPNYCAKRGVKESVIYGGTVSSSNRLHCYIGWTHANASDRVLTCQPSEQASTGNWVGTAKCVYKAGFCPSTPVTGGVISSGIRYASANVTCDPGYRRVNSTPFTCKFDKTLSWSRGYWRDGDQQCISI